MWVVKYEAELFPIPSLSAKPLLTPQHLWPESVSFLEPVTHILFPPREFVPLSSTEISVNSKFPLSIQLETSSAY